MVYLLHSIQDSEDQRGNEKKGEQLGKLKDTNLYWRLVQKEWAKKQYKWSKASKYNDKRCRQ